MLLILLAVCAIGSKTSYIYARVKSEIYLCNKYDAKPSEFEMIGYKRSSVERMPIGELMEKLVWIDFSFEYKYKEKHFIVNRENGKFYDDYQLEDVEEWCTDWLKENVDERIVGVDLESGYLYDYQKTTKEMNMYIISSEDTKDFLSSLKICTLVIDEPNVCKMWDSKSEIVNEINIKADDKFTTKYEKAYRFAGVSHLEYTPPKTDVFLANEKADVWFRSITVY